jgi:asparagine synthase (glutamine-hydrolysing)
MCGIAGKFNFNPQQPVARERLAAMTDVIAHRGPDADGFYVGDGIGLGHRRLSIIDLSTGDQPLSNETHTIWVVFNGEIYNFAEIRTELEACGHRFRTHSDTEVIVHAYEQWGDAAVDRFRGMFAFALWDEPKRRLLLVRDRLGVKPLYYSATPNGVTFGSEIKALLEDPDVPRMESRGARLVPDASIRAGAADDVSRHLETAGGAPARLRARPRDGASLLGSAVHRRRRSGA